mmetsp:Transcript_758/g.1772  ORF Transcript_758/g.1772 Transcript_758/m.1772 type:complete len:213 (-) Transcript_758:220-858(-)
MTPQAVGLSLPSCIFTRLGIPRHVARPEHDPMTVTVHLGQIILLLPHHNIQSRIHLGRRPSIKYLFGTRSASRVDRHDEGSKGQDLVVVCQPLGEAGILVVHKETGRESLLLVVGILVVIVVLLVVVVVIVVVLSDVVLYATVVIFVVYYAFHDGACVVSTTIMGAADADAAPDTIVMCCLRFEHHLHRKVDDAIIVNVIVCSHGAVVVVVA